MRTVLGVIAGIITGFVVVGLFDGLAHVAFPIDGPQPKSVEEMKLALKSGLIPQGQFVVMALGHLVALLVGAFVCWFIAKGNKIGIYITLGLLSIATIANLFMLPHPTFFLIIDFASIAIGWMSSFFFLSKNKPVN